MKNGNSIKRVMIFISTLSLFHLPSIANVCNAKKEKHSKCKRAIFIRFFPCLNGMDVLFTWRFLRCASFILIMLAGSAASAQIFYKAFYPEKELLIYFKSAKTPAEQMDAAGALAQHYKSKFKDSSSSVYLGFVYSIANAANDLKLKAKALWWDAHISAGITAYDETGQAVAKADSLLHFAQQRDLYEEAIAANLLLTDINIHKGLAHSERYASNAKQLLSQWKIDSAKKDSLKLEADYRLAHVYIHKKEGENAAQYLLQQQDYAVQSRNEALKIQAVDNLAQLYSEWPGQEENARQWLKYLYDYYKRVGQKSRLSIVAYYLGGDHLRIKDTAGAISYFKEAEQLQETLKIYTPYMYWLALEKRSLGLLTNKEFIELLDNGFNNHLFLPSALIDLHKAAIYMEGQQLDSAGYYLSKAKKDKFDSLGTYFSFYDYLPAEYYLQRKDYVNAIKAFNQLKRKAEEQGNRNKLMQALLGLSKAYEGKGDYKTANAFLTRYYEMRDSLNKLNYNAKVAFMEVQKEKTQAQNERKVNRQSLHKHWLYALIIIISLISVASYFLSLSRFRQLQLTNQLAKEKTEKLLAEKEYENKLNEVTHAALRSQMNPHFIFNALNTIQSYVYSNDKKTASNYLGKFSELIRKILDNSRKKTITLEEEIELLQLYIDIEKARFGDTLHAVIEVDRDVDIEGVHIPPMLIQPYVENAIKHGLLHKTEEKKLFIVFRKSEDQQDIEIVIEDNGIGRSKSIELNKTKLTHNSFANAANEKRIDLLYELFHRKAKLEIIDKINQDGSAAGTRVTITIPVVLSSIV